MKEIRRSRRLRLPRPRQQLTKPITSDNDESDLEHEAIGRSNKNSNRMPTTLFDMSAKDKQQQTFHSSSDQSSLFLYSISSIQKATAISDDLTPLTITTTNTTPLTTLTYSNTKQTETVKIDLTQLSGTDTLDNSLTNSDHDLHRKTSTLNLSNKMKDLNDTDTSMKSITFSKDYSLEQDLPCFTNGDCKTGTSRLATEGVLLPASVDTNVNTYQRSSIRWNLQNMTSRFKFLIGCSSLGLIVGIVLLAIIL